MARIGAVFAQFSAVESAVLYGSRAKGTHRVGSDIDLTLMGASLTHDDLNQIAAALDDLLLPYTIDLSIFAYIDNLICLTIFAASALFFTRYDYETVPLLLFVIFQTYAVGMVVVGAVADVDFDAAAQ